MLQPQDLTRSLDTVSRHGDVEQHHVGLLQPGEFDGLGRRTALADDLNDGSSASVWTTPVLNSEWSSTTRTRILSVMVQPPVDSHFEAGSAARSVRHRKHPAEAFHAVAHAG